jgi:hypothetical protein
MAVDADDLVHRDLAAFVAAQPADAPGWQLRQGYVWRDGSRLAIHKRVDFQHLCGTCAIVRADLAPHMFSDEPWFRHGTEAPGGEALTPLPFAGAVYRVMHDDNLFFGSGTVAAHRGDRNVVAYGLRQVVRYRPALMTRRLMRQFALR